MPGSPANERFYASLSWLFVLSFAATLLVTAQPSGLNAQVVSSHPVLINEVMASNGNTLADEDGDYPDWIEIFNAGADTVSLYLFGLSDNENQPFKWVFPDTLLAPGEFLLVWASGKNRSQAGGPLHTGFSISSSGEEIVLTAPYGERIDFIPPTAIPGDISYGRYPDGSGSFYFFTEPTPGGQNPDNGYLGLLPEVSFSTPGGFYTEPFSLTFTNAGRGTDIRYTLDGSEPGEHSPIYSGPLSVSDRSPEPNVLANIRTTIPDDFWAPPLTEIFKGTVIRARKMRDGYLPGNTVTHTFFVMPEGGNRYSLPVFSISTDSVNLFGFDEGIYVPGASFDGNNFQTANYAQRGPEWERPVHMELFHDGFRVYATDAGARIHGGWSRRHMLKSLRLYARSDYGDSRFHYPFFGVSEPAGYNRLILRNSGNDFWGTMFKDGFIQSLVSPLLFDTQAYQPSKLFINGEYWGIRNIRERYDRHYLERVHGADPDRIDLLTGFNTIQEGDNDHYMNMIIYIHQNSLSDSAHYNHVTRLMDIGNFIDYMISNIYVRNTDWPGNNIDFWRYRADSLPGGEHHALDGRWRWLMFDTDFGFGFPWEDLEDVYRHNTLAFATENDPSISWPNPDWSTFLLRNLLENDLFRHRFINRFADLMNTIFDPEHVKELIDRMASVVEPYMPEHLDRSRVMPGISEWFVHVDRLRSFAEFRPEFQRTHILDQFELEGTYQLTIDVNHEVMGSVRVNTLALIKGEPAVPDIPYPWTGTYYLGIPLKIAAEPAKGFRFLRWEEATNPSTNSVFNPVSDTSATIIIHPGGDLTLTAVFGPDDADPLFPRAYNLHMGPYRFMSWAADNEPGSFPNHMAFHAMDATDPRLDALPAEIVSGAYNLTAGTRINGLADGGVSFLNAADDAINEGFPAERLGAAVLALNTLEMENIRVSFTSGTIEPNSLVYHLRLQYRVGADGPFRDVTDATGLPVEYERSAFAGHSRTIGPVLLPEQAENQPYVQLMWRYYHTGEQKDPESTLRTRLRLDNIVVEGEISTSIGEDEPETPSGFELHQNYPNPFNPNTRIRFELPESGFVRIHIYNMAGQRVAIPASGTYATGTHVVDFDASSLSSGVYLYRMYAPGYTQTRKMMLIK